MKIKKFRGRLSDEPDSIDDIALGMKLGKAIGDTRIAGHDASSDQWTTVVKLLRLHGLKITESEHNG